MARGSWALPLASERSPVELGIERASALAAVATHELQVNAAIDPDVLKDLSRVPAIPHELLATSPAGPATYAPVMRELVSIVMKHRPTPLATASEAFAKQWGGLGEVLFHWDAAIQDSLLSVSDQMANGYELGRVLAEAYWSLDPLAPPTVAEAGTMLPNPSSWQFLLGEERRAVTSRLLQRLAPYFAPLVAPAVAASVEVWGSVVAPELPARHIWGTKRQNRKTRTNTWWKAADSRASLRQQVANWYSLIVAGLDPETLLKPYAVLRSWRSTGRALRVLAAEAIVAAIGAVLLVVLGVLLAHASKNATLEVVLASLGALGITGAGVQTRIKAKTQAALTRLGADLSTELVAAQITITPTRPEGTNRLWEANEEREAIARRTVTAALLHPT